MRSAIFKIYRHKHVPRFLSIILIAGIFLWLTAFKAMQEIPSWLGQLVQASFVTALIIIIVMFAAIAAARIHYRLRPACRTCGIDSVECKIRRNTIMPHAKPRN